MDFPIAQSRDEILRAYAAGDLGTRNTIERLGLHDYADLIIALVEQDLSPPRPADTPSHRAQVDRARAILQPRLRHGG
jgi:hypothetical protein